MHMFISYILLGVTLAAPIGPVNAAQLDKGLKNGFLHAWLVGLGAMTADVFYMLCVYFGLISLIEGEFIKSFLYLFGCFVLTYTGIESLIGAGKVASSSLRNHQTLRKSFSSGFLLSISNPLSILFWLGIYGSILAKTVHSSNTNNLLISSAGIFIGLLLWDVTMAGLASTFRKFLHTKLLILISILSGLSLIAFGIYFGKEAILILFF
ncbi:putative amino acid efflux protein YcgF [Heyndrickxia sporothermodurans]|nr:putative amino acid efflux protein YcgF [Heyndrickxia sporothermodurans]